MKFLKDLTFNGATLLSFVLTSTSFFLPLINIKKNRIDLGSLSSLNDFSKYIIIIYTVLIIALLIQSTTLIGKLIRNPIITQLLRQITSIMLLYLLGNIILESNVKIERSGEIRSQISFLSGFYLIVLATYVQLVGKGQLLTDKNKKIDYIVYIIVVFLSISFILLHGQHLGIVKEFIKEKKRFSKELIVHISIAFRSVLYASIIAIPLGIISWKHDKIKNIIFSFINSLQTIPSLALFGLIIAPLAALTQRFPILKSMGVRGIGETPALLALTLYALLPIVRNTYIGLDNINPSVIDAGRGMGMTERQRFIKIEIQLASPLLLTGIKIAAIQSIGNTTIAALIGAGGLGFFVFRGLEQIAPDLILIGVIPIVILVVISDKVLSLFIRLLTLKSLRRGHD